MVQSELSVMSRVIGHSTMAGAFPAAGARFQTDAARLRFPPRRWADKVQ